MAKGPFKIEAEILTALAHPNRMRIIDSLWKGTKYNCKLMPELGSEQSNLSRHLKVLTALGPALSKPAGVIPIVYALQMLGVSVGIMTVTIIMVGYLFNAIL